MARTPKPIPPKAVAAWERGDELAAVRLSGLQSRQLRNRLGAPGRPAAASPPPDAPEAAPPPQRLVKVPPRSKAAPSSPPPDPPPSDSGEEPDLAAIAKVDTREEAERMYRLIATKLATADEVRFASLAEKALGAINRIEQIDARRPKPPAVDEVVRRLVEVKGRAVERFAIAAREAVRNGLGA